MDSTKLRKISDSLLNMLLIEKTNSAALKKILILALIFLCAFQIGNLQANLETSKTSESPIEKRIENFFNSLKRGQTDLAFSKLLENSPIAKDKANITKLVNETDQTLKKYGKIKEFEKIKKDSIGSRNVRFTYFSYSDNFPLKWEIYFYSGKSGWQILDFNLNNNFYHLFNSPKK